MTNSNITITHNIDFSTPSIYVVMLTQHKGACQFPVQVVGKPKEIPPVAVATSPLNKGG